MSLYVIRMPDRGIFVARYYDLFEKAMMISNEIKKK